MTVPVIEIQGIGSKTAEFLKSHGILTAEDLLKDGTNCLGQAPGFGKDRAEQVLKVIATSLVIDDKNSSKKTESKKDKKIPGKDKKKSDKKNSRKKDKDKKKNKKNKKDKKNKKNKKK